AERHLFAQLSIFAGGFTLESASAIAGHDVLRPLARLVSTSLVIRESNSEPISTVARFRLLEPLRQVGQLLLSSDSESFEAWRDRHAAYFLALAEAAQRALWGRGPQGTGVFRLEPEVDNLRTALRCLIDQADADRAGRLGAVLARFWMYSNRVAEARRWLD